MNRLAALDTQRPELENWVTGMAQQLGDSAICLSIFTKDYARGIDSLLQFAVALMMDKPIFLLVPRGLSVPEHVKRVADGIEFFDEGDPVSASDAARKLIQQAQQRGFCA